MNEQTAIGDISDFFPCSTLMVTLAAMYKKSLIRNKTTPTLIKSRRSISVPAVMTLPPIVIWSIESLTSKTIECLILKFHSSLLLDWLPMGKKLDMKLQNLRCHHMESLHRTESLLNLCFFHTHLSKSGHKAYSSVHILVS